MRKDVRFSVSHGCRLLTSVSAVGIALFASALWSQTNTFPPSGNVGIGTTNPSLPLDVRGMVRVANDDVNLQGWTGWWTGSYTTINSYKWSSPAGFQPLRVDGSVLLLNSSSGGNVGIGTTNPAHLLHVAGTIGAKEVIVSATGADYVFDPDYRLTPLAEVASYIKDTHHLPDIPSEPEIREKGVGLGEMQTKLLAKIEELTLHMIAEDERIDRLEHENGELRRELQEVKEEIPQ